MTYRVSVDVLCDGMDNNIRSMIQRILKIRTHEGIIDNNQDSMLMSDGGHLADIHQPKSRVRRALDPDKLGIIGSDQSFNINLDSWGEGNMNAMCRSDFCEVSMGTTVNIGDGDDMGARGKRLEDRGGSCGAGRESEGISCVLESCYTLLELISSNSQTRRQNSSMIS